MIRPLNINNETASLKTVVLGVSKSSGPTPKADDCYDPSSRSHVISGTYPIEIDMVNEMQQLEAVFEKYGVEVLRPQIIEQYNQIFARDIAFVIEDKLIRANILPDRDKEFDAIQQHVNQIDPKKIITLPNYCHIEGGDVILYNNYIFIGVYSAADYSDYITARTNKAAVSAISALFPNKIVIPFELKKSNTDALNNALHLDCCFQPVGKGKVLMHKNGFLNPEDVLFIEKLFGEKNIFEVNALEMSQMQCNVFSISEQVIVSEKKFTRLNSWLQDHGLIVEKVSYSEIAKQGGLLRCSTLPLYRE